MGYAVCAAGTEVARGRAPAEARRE